MEVTRLDSDGQVSWSCVGGADEWVGTKVSFALTPKDDETVVLFAMFPQQVQDLHKAKANGKPAVEPTAAAAASEPKAPVAAPAAVHSSAARKLFVTVEGLRHDVTVETLEG